MKVIFLDIDGVLNSEHWYVKNHKKHPERCRSGQAIDPRFVRNLRRIVKKTDAKIVITSTMRGTLKHQSDHRIHEIFKQYGLVIYDYTFRVNSSIRGYEIQEWLDRHKEVTNIVIIDDNNDMVHLSKYLVQTINIPCDKMRGLPFAWLSEGLNSRVVKEAIEMLNKPYVNIYSTKVSRKVF